MNMQVSSIGRVELFKSTTLRSKAILDVASRMNRHLSYVPTLFGFENFRTGKMALTNNRPAQWQRKPHSHHGLIRDGCARGHEIFERMGANRDVNPIKLDTRLGNCTLKISAQVQNDKVEKLAAYALQFLIWHIVPAEAYKKGSDFKRDTAYSDALSAHMVKACKSELAEVFSDVEITTAQYDKPDPIAKMVKEFTSLGMDEATAKAMVAEVMAKAKKTEAKTEAKPEEKEAVVKA